jgi:Zn-dependent peptidase ImmA (M78 family)
LSPPVNVKKLAKEYAKLKFSDIPFDIDGITANLKVSGVRPTILVNENRPLTRQRFTLAHEIGHVVIPWHMGTIFDLTDAATPDGAIEYWEMEAEANAFATELLMPTSWVDELVNSNDNPADINEVIASEAKVSAIAATLRLSAFLPNGYIFAVFGSDGKVTYSGKSGGTHATAPARGVTCEIEKHYEYASNFFEFTSGNERHVWVELPEEIDIDINGNRDWRIVLDEIIDDVANSKEEGIKYKQRLNGVMGFANGAAKRGTFNEKTLCSVCTQRLTGNDCLKPVTNHPKFQQYLAAKVRDLIEKAKR